MEPSHQMNQSAQQQQQQQQQQPLEPAPQQPNTINAPISTPISSTTTSQENSSASNQQQQPQQLQPVSSTQVTSTPQPTQLAPPMKQRLQDLVNEVDPDEQLDEDVEEILLEIADEFIEDVVSSACSIAKHRNSTSLDIEDIKLYLERKYKIWVPGFGESRHAPKPFTSEAHKQRMALIASRSVDDTNSKQK